MAVSVVRTDPRVVHACELLLERVDDVACSAARIIREEEPQYIDLMSQEELARAVRPNVIGLVESVMVNETSLLAAPRRTGRERAQARVPLTIVLHAYRLAALHIWDQLVALCDEATDTSRALLDSASALWSAVDVYSQELATAYRDVETEQLLRNVRVREAALASLFSGVNASSEGFADVADALRLPKVGSFVVVAADSWAVENEGAPASTERALTSLGVRSAWRSEPDGEVGLVALTRSYRVDRLMSYLASLEAGRVGISETFEAIVDTPQAVKQAQQARDTATPGEDVVMRFEDARRRPGRRHARPRHGARPAGPLWSARAERGRAATPHRHPASVVRRRGIDGGRGPAPALPRQHGALPPLQGHPAHRAGPAGAERRRPSLPRPRDPPVVAPGSERLRPGCTAAQTPRPG